MCYEILHRYFLYDRKILADLSRCDWKYLKVFLQQAIPENDSISGAVIAIQHEEYKISVFAQEIKTAFPVSAKWLEKKIQEIERMM
ncbi:MAG: DUF3418 domain-containing protein [Deltaproteobacteria bacterium]